MRTVIGSVIFEEAAGYLEDFFVSLEKQTDQDFTVMLVNDNIRSEYLEQIVEQIPQKLRQRVVIVDKSGEKLMPCRLRVELLQSAYERGDELLIMMDCDDKASENRISCVREQFDAQYTFFYNELLDFDGKRVMQHLPAHTLDYRDIGEKNYLGLSNGAIYLKSLSKEFIQSLKAGETKVFDWYLYSRLLLDGKKGKRVDGCYTYYRIYEENLAGKCVYSKAAIDKELAVKRQHYGLLAQYNQYYEDLLEKYTEITAEDVKARETGGYWWSLIDSLNDTEKKERGSGI